MSGEAILWTIFGVAVVGMVYLDLFVLHRKSHEVHVKEALAWSAVWIAVSLLFNLGILVSEGSDRALEFLTAYLIEKSLSIDNLFVFLLVFTYFGIPLLYQHKALMWGIIGALVLRAGLIASGIALIENFHFIIFLFGGFLIFTGARMLIDRGKEPDPGKNLAVRIFRRLYPVTDDLHGDRFFIVRAGRRMATPLLAALIAINVMDLAFAVDSVPAVLAITSDTFIVYTSNIFAILGLRALYFALAGVMKMFSFLQYGLATILVFVGIKMVVSDAYDMPASIALGAIAGILLVSIAASARFRPRPTAGDAVLDVPGETRTATPDRPS